MPGFSPDRPGVTLFGNSNVGSVAEMTSLTAALQEAAGTDLPLLIAADHEGGQLLGAGPATTPFPGNMALGAADDTDLSEAVGRAMGRELRALGITVDYAPVCDLATHPDNPSLGIRAFGDDPARVGELAAAMVRGLQSEGVAAAAKHFPGKGDAVVDPHYELPRARPRPATGSRRSSWCRSAPRWKPVPGLVMVGHYALPAFTWSDDLPSSLSAGGGRRPAQKERRVRRGGDHRCAQHARPRPGVGDGGRCDRRARRRGRSSALRRWGGAAGSAALRSWTWPAAAG